MKENIPVGLGGEAFRCLINVDGISSVTRKLDRSPDNRKELRGRRSLEGGYISMGSPLGSMDELFAWDLILTRLYLRRRSWIYDD